MNRIVCMILACCLILLCQGTALAADESPWIITEGEETVDLTEYRSEVMANYRMLQGVSLAIGGVSVAMSAFQLLQGNGQAQERAKRKIIWSLIVVAIVNLLPLVISTGASLGMKYAWTP